MRAQKNDSRIKQIQKEYELVNAELASDPGLSRVKELLKKAKNLGLEKSRLEGKWN